MKLEELDIVIESYANVYDLQDKYDLGYKWSFKANPVVVSKSNNTAFTLNPPNMPTKVYPKQYLDRVTLPNDIQKADISIIVNKMHRNFINYVGENYIPVMVTFKLPGSNKLKYLREMESGAEIRLYAEYYTEDQNV